MSAVEAMADHNVVKANFHASAIQLVNPESYPENLKRWLTSEAAAHVGCEACGQVMGIDTHSIAVQDLNHFTCGHTLSVVFLPELRAAVQL